MKSSIFQKMTQKIWRISPLCTVKTFRAEILQIFRVIFGEIGDFINSFRLNLTFRTFWNAYLNRNGTMLYRFLDCNSDHQYLKKANMICMKELDDWVMKTGNPTLKTRAVGTGGSEGNNCPLPTLHRFWLKCPGFTNYPPLDFQTFLRPCKSAIDEKQGVSAKRPFLAAVILVC